MSVAVLLYLMYSHWVAAPTLALGLVWGASRLARGRAPELVWEKGLRWAAVAGLGLWLVWGTAAALMTGGPVFGTWLVPFALLSPG